MKATPREVHMGGGKVRFARPFLGAAWEPVTEGSMPPGGLNGAGALPIGGTGRDGTDLREI